MYLYIMFFEMKNFSTLENFNTRCLKNKIFLISFFELKKFFHSSQESQKKKKLKINTNPYIFR
jgi:hypothetical protein